MGQAELNWAFLVENIDKTHDKWNSYNTGHVGNLTYRLYHEQHICQLERKAKINMISISLKVFLIFEIGIEHLK